MKRTIGYYLVIVTFYFSLRPFALDRNELCMKIVSMPEQIQDEFTHRAKEISRQRLHQLRRKRDGKCVICGRPAKNKTHCEMHARKHAIKSLQRYHDTHTKES